MPRFTGKIASWNEERGFGFIMPSSGGKQVFVHAKALPRHARTPAIGTRVTFETAKDNLGRLRAEKVRTRGLGWPFGPAFGAFFAALVYIVLVAKLARDGRLPIALLWIDVGLSVISLVLYYFDKAAARQSAQRIPENTLHLVALLGGWPGALYAQQLLRHKSSKASFRIVFWLTVAINAAAMVYMLLPPGSWLVELLDRLWFQLLA